MHEENANLRENGLGQFIELLIDFCQKSVFAGLIQGGEELLGIDALRNGEIAIEQVLGIICVFALCLHIAGDGHAKQHGMRERGFQAGKLLFA